VILGRVPLRGGSRGRPSLGPARRGQRQAEEPDRTLSERFVKLLPFLTVPFVFGLIAFDERTVLLFGMTYGVGLVVLATAVGVYDARRNPAP